MPTVLITGANRGLGLEFSRQYAQNGWKVIATCRRPDSTICLETIAGEIQVRIMDVTDPLQVKTVAEDFKSQPVDVLLNNAGIFGPSDDSASFGNVDIAAWLEVIRVNAIAPLKVTEAFIDNVKASTRKTIVFISSHAGSIGDRGLLPHHRPGGSYIYRSSKAALNAIARSLALELKTHGVGILVLHPGWVRTDLGGPQATIDKEASVSGMRRVIEHFSCSQTGSFRSYDGQVIPW